MAVAADPRLVPLGTKLYIKFQQPFINYSGVYTVRDTGGSVHGRKIDLFMGDFRRYSPRPSVFQFGIRKARVYILKGK
jgi:3D (Asp-Asp-Asp) domain-containing protein